MDEHDDEYYAQEARSVLAELLGHQPKSWPNDNVLVQTGRLCEQTMDEEEFSELLSGAVESGEEWAIALFRWVGTEIGLQTKGPDQPTGV